MQKNENRPGYKETKVGWIPKEWEETTLENIASVERGKFSARPRNDPQYYGGQHPFLQTGDVSTSDGIVNGYSQTLNERGLTVSRLFPSGTLLITIAANIGDIAEVPFEFACPDSLVAVQPNAKSHRLWLKYFLKTKKEYFESKATQNAQANINLQTIRPAAVQLPSLPEQKAIAGVLECWDRGIRTLENKIEKKRLIKKGLMQRLLSGQLRLSGFSEYWKEKTVDEIFDVTRGQVLAVNKMQQKRAGKYCYPVYSSQTKSNGLTGHYTEYLYENAITWTTDGANAGDVKYRPGKFYCTNVCGVLLGDYANQCIAEILNMVSRKYVSYVGNPKLMNNVMGKIKITLPPLEEQQAIAEVLSAADGEIEVLERKLGKWKDQKKYLLNNLVTGTIRLPQFRN